MVKKISNHKLSSKTVKYENVSFFAKSWTLSDRSIRDYCAKGKIKGAKLDGKTWLIPKDAQKPERKNKSKTKNNILLNRILEEKKHKISGGIYHKIQIDLTYNSNHIEGSKLTHDETRYIFETRTIGNIKNKSTDDIVETVNHFRCIDTILDNVNHKLSESLIKKLHLILKNGTSDSMLSWFKVGSYKKLPNEVGGIKTTSPGKVAHEMKKLLNTYNDKSKITFEDLLDFHYKFEKIHPFQDGNGRIGRLILFKECLKNGIVPFIISDELKYYYYRGLSKWKSEKGYLMDTCLSAQDEFKKSLDYFEINY